MRVRERERGRGREKELLTKHLSELVLNGSHTKIGLV